MECIEYACKGKQKAVCRYNNPSYIMVYNALRFLCSAFGVLCDEGCDGYEQYSRDCPYEKSGFFLKGTGKQCIEKDTYQEEGRRDGLMVMRFYNDEWELFITNCGFTDDELEIIPDLRRGWACIDIAEELNVSLSTLKRRRTRIGKKIIRYIAKQG